MNMHLHMCFPKLIEKYVDFICVYKISYTYMLLVYINIIYIYIILYIH